MNVSCMDADAEWDGEMIHSVLMSPTWPHGSQARQWPSGPAGGAG